jgi:hypothetical protein
MEHPVQWKGAMYLGTKFGGKEMQPNVIQFVSILLLKLLGCCDIILPPIRRPPVGLYRN